jgi:hypothetical protein
MSRILLRYSSTILSAASHPPVLLSLPPSRTANSVHQCIDSNTIPASHRWRK